MSGTTYPTGPQFPAQPPKDNTLKIVLIVLAVVLLVVLLVCGGLIGLGIYATRQVASTVQAGLAEAIAGEILESPEAQQALGDITSMRVEFRDLAVQGDSQTIPVQVEGTEGSGVLQLELRNGAPSQATLIMDDGETIELEVPQAIEVQPGEPEQPETLTPDDAPPDESPAAPSATEPAEEESNAEALQDDALQDDALRDDALRDQDQLPVEADQ